MAFKDTNNTFSDIAVTSRLEKINSFLKQIDSIIDFEKLRPILNKNGITEESLFHNRYSLLLVQKIS